MTTSAPPRLLPLEGGYNLRDMGGYVGAGGRSVRYRVLYRSGMMSMLTEADEAHLAGLGISTVCDLRRAGERMRDPTRWCDPAGAVYWSRDYGESSGVLSEMMRGGATSAADMRMAMIELYRELPGDHAPSYRFMFDRLLSGQVPLLFNCSAGKDRTGVAAALILHALGVSREDIYEDYLLTNSHADYRRLVERFGEHGRRFGGAGAEILVPLLSADADYLDAMFEALDRDHGGIDDYLKALGVDDDGKTRLREVLLD